MCYIPKKEVVFQVFNGEYFVRIVCASDYNTALSFKNIPGTYNRTTK